MMRIYQELLLVPVLFESTAAKDFDALVRDIINNDVLMKVFLAICEVTVAFVLGSMVKSLIDRMDAKAINKGMMTFFASFCNISIKIAGIIVALDQLGVRMELIVGALSALGVGISLALKDNMASVASGLQILLTRPFKVGDYVRIGKREGKVEAIEMTFTVLMNHDEETEIIPNNKVIAKTVINYSNQPKRKITIQYPTPKENATKDIDLLRKAALRCPLVSKEPAPAAYIASYDLPFVNLELECYADQQVYWQAYKQVLDAVHEIDEAESNPVPAAGKPDPSEPAQGQPEAGSQSSNQTDGQASSAPAEAPSQSEQAVPENPVSEQTDPAPASPGSQSNEPESAAGDETADRDGKNGVNPPESDASK